MHGIFRTSVALAVVCLAIAGGAAQDKNPAPAGEKPVAKPAPVVVLDTTGFWRMHHTLRPPVIQTPQGPTPLMANRRWLNDETPEPPKDWASPPAALAFRS